MKIDWAKAGLILIIAVAVEAICLFIDSPFLCIFLRNKTVEIQITLMAINTATSSFIVSKVHEIAREDKSLDFAGTYAAVKFALIEQIGLIVISAVVLTLAESKVLQPYYTPRVGYIFDVLLLFTFIYALDILRDTGVSMFDVLIEQNNRGKNKAD